MTVVTGSSSSTTSWRAAATSILAVLLASERVHRWVPRIVLGALTVYVGVYAWIEGWAMTLVRDVLVAAVLLVMMLPLLWLVFTISWVVRLRRGAQLVTARRGWHAAAVWITPEDEGRWHAWGLVAFPLRRRLATTLGRAVLAVADEEESVIWLRPASDALRAEYERYGFEPVEGSRRMMRKSGTPLPNPRPVAG